MAEDKEMFETIPNYKDETGPDSIQVVLEFDEEESKEANVAVSNYLSHVNGRIASVNGQSTVKNKVGPTVGGMIGLKGELGIGLGLGSRAKISNKTVYQILVPNGAKFSNNIQERIDRYLKYKKEPLISFPEEEPNGKQ